MNASNYRVRRATVEDIPELGPLLQATMLPVSLEKRFTEFQVTEAADGRLVGALGLQIAGKHGKIHSESYVDFGLADTLRPMLWERIQSIAQTQQLVRFWTQETAPFWKQSGFAPVATDLRQKMPAAFGDTKADWLTLKLKEDLDNLGALDKEFTEMMAMEKARTQEMLNQAKMLRGIAIFFAVIMSIGIVAATVYLLMKSNFLGRR